MEWDLIISFIREIGPVVQGLLASQPLAEIIKFGSEKNQQKFESELEKVRQKYSRESEEYRRETQMLYARSQLESTLAVAEHQEIREKFPLKTPAKVILEFYKQFQDSDRPIPLLVILSPPGLKFEKFPHAANGFSKIESRLVDGVGEFCKHYPLNSAERPIKFQGADWNSKVSHGQSAVDILHHVLKSIPTVILESKVDGDLLKIYLANWDMMEEIPHYQKVLTIPWKEVLYPIAREYAQHWQRYRMEMLGEGSSLEWVKQWGEDDEVNLCIMQREQRHEELGLSTNRDYKYKVNDEKYIHELSDVLEICHCILVGIIADRYHFDHGDVRPKLPELLPKLLAKVSDEYLQGLLLEQVVSSYQNLYQFVEEERAHLLPDLLLDLSLSFSHLSKPSWAKSQLKNSLKSWLNLREIEPPEDLQALLTGVKSALLPADTDYAEKLNSCLIALREIYLENSSVVHTLEMYGKPGIFVIKPDGQTLVSVNRYFEFQIWRLNTGETIEQQCVMMRDNVWPYYLAISPNGETVVSGVVTGNDDNTITTVRLKPEGSYDFAPRGYLLRGYSGVVFSLAISPDGQTLVIGSADNTIKTWRLNPRKELVTLTGHSGAVRCLAISPDSRTLVSGSDDTTIKVWDSWRFYIVQELHTLTGHSGAIRCLAISPDGQTLVSGSEDNTIKVWQLNTGQEVHTLTGHSGVVRCLAISPNGQIIVSGSDDHTIKVWQLNTGQLLGTLTGHYNSVYALAISPDGQTLVSGSEDNTIKIWQVQL